MLPTLQTDRLTLRPLALQDAPQLFMVYSDPEVTRFLGDGKPVLTLEQQAERVAKRLEVIKGYPSGHGRWIATKRDSEDDLLGLVILEPLDTEVEIGWHFARRAWGHGFASEAGAAILAYGLSTLGLSRVCAVVRPDNPRSAAVARRLGMQWTGRTDRYYGQELDFFVAGDQLS